MLYFHKSIPITFLDGSRKTLIMVAKVICESSSAEYFGLL